MLWNVNFIYIYKCFIILLIANKSNATILGISETKLDETIMDSELYIEGYDLIRSDRNRHGGGVACYIKKERHYNVPLTLKTSSSIFYLKFMQFIYVYI